MIAVVLGSTTVPLLRLFPSYLFNLAVNPSQAKNIPRVTSVRRQRFGRCLLLLKLISLSFE